MTREALLIVFHLIASVQFVFGTYYGFLVLDVPEDVSKMFSGYGGKFKFFTFWNGILQAIFFLICTLNDWFGTNAVNPKKPPLIRKFKDLLHASLGFPVAAFVALVFWTLMFIDRELVFPKVLDPYFPWWLNHLMHSMVLVSTVIEMIIAPRQYPRRLTGLSTTVIFDFIYLIWVNVIYYKSGIWVYPLLSLMSVPVRMLFMLSMMVFNGILYFVGEAIHNFVWGKKYVAESDGPVW
ncbi:androgen-dependent TFPI-regulating protein isoform X2 [Halictus rubicundus]|uniref:androgen-dependent TFPI-regulating protein isoform X2 n=1 Tax=Halictus rubicundus TaxID=77578 RepID=UPI0040369BDA